MINQQHPITPPPELVEQWHSYSPLDRGLTLATCAAQWGADQELEAIIELAGGSALPEEDRYLDGITVASLRAQRRPEPPSLKEQALALLEYKEYGSAKTGIEYRLTKDDAETLRRALEQLND